MSCLGCTTVNSYAVMTPRTEVQNYAGCFRQCQTVRAGGTNAYLSCVRTCPGTTIVDQESCEELPVDNRFECMTEHNKSFSGGKTFLLIAILVVGVIAIGAASANSNNANGM
jgi:hypothetical protein